MLDQRKQNTMEGAFARAALLFAMEQGVGADGFEQVTRISAGALLDPQGGVPHEFLSRLLRHLERMLPGQNAALALARRVPFAAIGEHWAVLRRAPTGSAMLRLVHAGSALFSPVLTTVLETTPALALSMQHPLDAVDDGLGAEVALGVTARITETHFGPGLIERLEFAHRPRGRTAAYAAFFGAPVAFEQPRNRVVYRPGIADVPNRWSHLEAEAELRRQLDHMLRERGLVDDTLLADVRSAIVSQAQRRDFSADGLACALGTSRRSLQRKLKARGTHISALIDAHRLLCARGLLAEPSLDMLDISEALGFDSERGFRRAFERWTGMTPAQWRKANPPD